MSDAPFPRVDRHSVKVRQRAATKATTPKAAPAVLPAVPVVPPDNRTTEWHAIYAETYARLGTKRAACQTLHISRATVDEHAAKFPAFAAALAQAEETFREWVFEQGMLRVKNGSDSMIQFYLRALDPRFKDKRTIEYTMTDRDRREIERQAKEQGLDPAEILAEVERRQARRGQLKIVS